MSFHAVCPPTEVTILSSMIPEKGTNNLAANFQQRREAIVEVKENIAKNKKAGGELPI
jgi:hypothetical protein